MRRWQHTWLAKPRKAGAGWKALFTRIVASNEEIKRFLNIATTVFWWAWSFCSSICRLVCGWNLFLMRQNVQRACSAVVFDEFISHGKLFYRGHKTCNFFNAIFHRKDFWKKGKRFCRDSSVSSKFGWTLQLQFDPARKLSGCMQILLQQTVDASLSPNLLPPSNLPFVWRHSYFVFYCC